MSAISLSDVDLPFLDVRSPEYVANPFACVDRLRRADPRGGRLMRSNAGIDVVDYDLGRDLLADKRIVPPRADHFREMGAGPLLLQYLTEGKMTALQGEKHLYHRRVLNSPLTPRAVEAQRGMYRAIANRLVDGFIARRSCDLVADFAHRYPVEVLCGALGIPDEDINLIDAVTPEFTLINVMPLRPVVPRIEAALQSLSDYTARLLERRRHATAKRDDLIDELTLLNDQGALTHAEVVWSLVTLLQAAHYTTRNQLVSIVRAVLENDLWQELVDHPALIPAAVEEGMRFYPVVLAITRIAAADDIVIDGIAIPRGTILRFNVIGAGRDPHRFDDPHQFRLDRDDSRRIPFGYGAHKCLGHAMARSDMEVALEVLTSRLKAPRIVQLVEAEAIGAVWGANRLVLDFEPVSEAVA